VTKSAFPEPEDLEPIAVPVDDPASEPDEAGSESRPPTTSGGSKWRGIAIGIGIGIATTLGGIQILSQVNSTAQESPAPAETAPTATEAQATQTVSVATVEARTIARTFNATGTVHAYDMLPILPQATGLQIQEVLVDEGDYVERGQVLAILDDAVLQSEIDRAQAQVEAQQAMLGERQAAIAQAEAAVQQAIAARAEAAAAEENARAGQLEAEAAREQAIANLARAEADLAQAEREGDRYQTLADEGAVSQQELEVRRTAAQNAREAVRVAEANLRSAEAKIASARAQVESARARLKSADANVSIASAQVESARATASSATASVRNDRARVEQVKTQIDQTVVRAPADGIIAERIARVGDVTSGSQKLFSIVNRGELELHLDIPETQLPQVKIGSAVKVTSDADPRVQLRGTVREIAPLVNADSRQATVKVSLPASDLLRPGMFLRGAIATGTIQALSVPAKAVLPQSDKRAIVYLLDPDETVSAQTVEVGELVDGSKLNVNEAQVEIKSGLGLGDRVVVEGAPYVKDGDRVRIVGSGE
jgi:RND family efflux transporter MFP subunit